ncbi:hypothetical protein NDU88_007089 [Pleurodeles waltl]|uniref:Uncharacterized protein n=1 Tax=Pleurodeles waltl TaxID=8319 RepID=A0AAV7SRI5_PLEWA|nr:hypothetical protein NDU88_007089 [Pleurodeles waltl]
MAPGAWASRRDRSKGAPAGAQGNQPDPAMPPPSAQCTQVRPVDPGEGRAAPSTSLAPRTRRHLCKLRNPQVRSRPGREIFARINPRLRMRQGTGS